MTDAIDSVLDMTDVVPDASNVIPDDKVVKTHTVSTLREESLSMMMMQLVCSSVIGVAPPDTSALPKKRCAGGTSQWRSVFNAWLDTLEETTIDVLQDRPVARLRTPDQVVLDPFTLTSGIDFGTKPHIAFYYDTETTGFGLYAANILEFGFVAVLHWFGDSQQSWMHKKLGDFHSYVRNHQYFPESAFAVHGIPCFELDNRLRDADPLDTVNMRIRDWLQQMRSDGLELSKVDQLYSQLVSWNGANYDLPLWVYCTDEDKGVAGHWQDFFMTQRTGLIAHSDYYQVVRSLRLTPTGAHGKSHYRKQISTWMTACKGKHKTGTTRLDVVVGKQKTVNVARMSLSIPQMKTVLTTTDQSVFPSQLHLDQLPKPKRAGGKQYPAGATKTWRNLFNKWLLAAPDIDIVVPDKNGKKKSAPVTGATVLSKVRPELKCLILWFALGLGTGEQRPLNQLHDETAKRTQAAQIIRRFMCRCRMMRLSTIPAWKCPTKLGGM